MSDDTRISLTAAEIIEAAAEHDAEWLRTRRIGCAEYVPHDNAIRLWVYAEGRDYYEVDLDRCRTAEQFTDWAFHLAGKTWCRGDVMMDFLLCLERAIKERHDQSPAAFFKAAFAAMRGR
jgi:hypothetical protein